jgi:hypothetical protein
MYGARLIRNGDKKMTKFKEDEIKQREDDLTAVLDAKNLTDLEERRPEVVEKIKALLEVGRSPEMIGKVIRRDNPQMWIESKFAESVARGLLSDSN